jgi:hypothetical protein
MTAAVTGHLAGRAGELLERGTVGCGHDGERVAEEVEAEGAQGEGVGFVVVGEVDPVPLEDGHADVGLLGVALAGDVLLEGRGWHLDEGDAQSTRSVTTSHQRPERSCTDPLDPRDVAGAGRLDGHEVDAAGEGRGDLSVEAGQAVGALDERVALVAGRSDQSGAVDRGDAGSRERKVQPHHVGAVARGRRVRSRGPGSHRGGRSEEAGGHVDLTGMIIPSTGGEP